MSLKISELGVRHTHGVLTPSDWPRIDLIATATESAVTVVQCRYNGCRHVGEWHGRSDAVQMSCAGDACRCTCCRLLSGVNVHGCTIDIK